VFLIKQKRQRPDTQTDRRKCIYPR